MMALAKKKGKRDVLFTKRFTEHVLGRRGTGLDFKEYSYLAEKLVGGWSEEKVNLQYSLGEERKGKREGGHYKDFLICWEAGGEESTSSICITKRPRRSVSFRERPTIAEGGGRKERELHPVCSPGSSSKKILN